MSINCCNQFIHAQKVVVKELIRCQNHSPVSNIPFSDKIGNNHTINITWKVQHPIHSGTTQHVSMKCKTTRHNKEGADLSHAKQSTIPFQDNKHARKHTTMKYKN